MRNEIGESLFRRIIDAMPHMICYVDREERYVFSNSAYDVVSGESCDQLRGKTIRDVIGEEAYAERKDFIKRALSGEEIIFELPIQVTDRKMIARVTYVPDRDPEGKVIGLFISAEDVTGQRKMEKLLRESEARFRQLADHIPVGVWLVEGTKFYFNRRFLEYAGLDTDEKNPKILRDVIHPEDQEHTVGAYFETQNTGKMTEFEFRRRRHDGAYRWFLGRCVALKGEDGTVKMLGTSVDIHDLKQAMSARDEFLSIASHELKTPIASLKLQAELRLTDLADRRLGEFAPEKLERMFKGDDVQLDKLTRLVEDMLDFERLDSGKLGIFKESFDMAHEVREVTQRFQHQLRSAGCEFSLLCEGAIVGEWDRFRIEQIYANLLTNAMRYGKGKPIHVRVDASNREVSLSVRDEGIGIAPENHERIFHKFERIAPTDRIRGLGIGLYVVKQLVALHGGTIRVESELGQGARFEVRLPR